jgi:hypothetical protein
MSSNIRMKSRKEREIRWMVIKILFTHNKEFSLIYIYSVISSKLKTLIKESNKFWENKNKGSSTFRRDSSILVEDSKGNVCQKIFFTKNCQKISLDLKNDTA